MSVHTEKLFANFFFLPNFVLPAYTHLLAYCNLLQNLNIII